jgi:fatty acid CoA ligase FadD9
MVAQPGASVAAIRFHEAVRRLGVGADRDIPHLGRELIRKYLADLKQTGLL